MAEGMGGFNNPIEQWIGGGAAHVQEMAGEMTPSARAQRQMFRAARNRQRTNQYGFSQAQMQQAQAQGNQQVQAATEQANNEIARQRAGGMLAGGAGTEAARAVAGQDIAGRAQVAGAVQQASNQQAMAQYGADQARIDAQADRGRQFWQRQANISMQTTGAGESKNWSPEDGYGVHPGKGQSSALTEQPAPTSTRRQVW